MSKLSIFLLVIAILMTTTTAWLGVKVFTLASAPNIATTTSPTTSTSTTIPTATSTTSIPIATTPTVPTATVSTTIDEPTLAEVAPSPDNTNNEADTTPNGVYVRPFTVSFISNNPRGVVAHFFRACQAGSVEEAYNLFVVPDPDAHVVNTGIATGSLRTLVAGIAGSTANEIEKVAPVAETTIENDSAKVVLYQPVKDGPRNWFCTFTLVRKEGMWKIAQVRA